MIIRNKIRISYQRDASPAPVKSRQMEKETSVDAGILALVIVIILAALTTAVLASWIMFWR